MTMLLGIRATWAVWDERKFGKVRQPCGPPAASIDDQQV